MAKLQLVLLILIALVSVSAAQERPLILFVPPNAAGPQLHEGAYTHGDWVRWPTRRVPDPSLDYPSLWTGFGWSRPQPPPEPLESPRLLKGHEGNLQALLSPGGEVPVWLGEVEGWDEVSDLARRTNGRVLVVEYPPDGKSSISRFWLSGRGWPQGHPVGRGGVAGFVGSSELVALARSPEAFTWSDVNPSVGGGPQRWVEHVREAGPSLLIVLGAILSYTAILSVWVLARDGSGRFGARLIRASFVALGAAVLGSQFDALIGLGNSALTWGGSFVVLGVAAWGLERLLQRLLAGRIELAPMQTIGWVLLAVTLSAEPVWTPVSPTFAALPGHAWALWLALLSTAAVLSAGRGSLLIPAGIVVATQAFRLGDYVWVPIVLIVSSFDRQFRWAAAPILLASVGYAAWRGVTSYPLELPREPGDLGRINASEWMVTAGSPAALVVLAFIGFLVLLRDRFVLARLRRVFTMHPSRSRLFRVSGGFAVLSLAQPNLLHAALATCVAATFYTLHEALLA